MGGVHSSCNSKGLPTAPYDPPEGFWVKENLDKKGHVYGFDMEGVKLKKSATIAVAHHSSVKHFDPRASVTSQS